MGIPKLTKFVKEHYQWKSVRVQRRSKIVIDGYSLCYTLYYRHHDWQLGGDYCEFYETVLKYFQELNKLEIVPYIVVDGIDYDNRKLSTAKSRFEQRLEVMAGGQSRNEPVLPLFAKSVFVDALRDLGLKFYVANGEADQDVVSLANFFCCPVLGNDSDFFIFNIEGGYIPICDESGSVVDLGGEVKLFLYKDFDSQLSLCNDDLRLYLPVFRGNDFQGGHNSPRLGIYCKMPVDEMLCGICNIKDEKCDMVAFDMKEEVSQFYRVEPNSFIVLSTSTFLRFVNPGVLPQWVLDLYRRGQFQLTSMSLLVSPSSKIWRCSVVIEDVRLPSAWEITKDVMPYIIGALLSGETCDVSEFVRKGTVPPFSLEEQKVRLAPKHLELLPVKFESVPQLPLDDRKKLLRRVFHCKGIAKSISRIPEMFKLFVIASRCWIEKMDNRMEVKIFYVHSLVCSILSCSGHLEPPEKGDTRLPNYDHCVFVHTFAQWQCMLHCVIAFNEILNHPYEYTSPGKLFSASVLLCYYLQDLNTIQKKMNELAILLVNVITKDLVPDQPVQTGVAQAAAVITTNRFESLKLARKPK